MKTFASLALVSAVALFGIRPVQAQNTGLQEQLKMLQTKAVRSGDLGDWEAVLDSAAFKLYRMTELWRGVIDILPLKDDSIDTGVFANATVVVTTGLLDHIDAEIFESSAASGRRIRSLEKEREERLIGWLAADAARFALGLHDTGSMTDEQWHQADAFAAALFAVLGKNPESYARWVSSLGELYSPGNEAARSYFLQRPSVENRIAELAKREEETGVWTSSLSTLLICLKTGTVSGENLDSLAALREAWPRSPYLARLEALCAHQAWLAGLQPETQGIKTVLPIAADRDPAAAMFKEYLQNNQPLTPSSGFLDDETAIPGDSLLFMKAANAYKAALAERPDFLLESAEAMLLARSGNTQMRNYAFKRAESAAAAEEGTQSFAARANFAALLYLSGRDYVRSQFMLEALAAASRGGKERQGLRSYPGAPGNELDLLINLAWMQKALGDETRAQATLDVERNLAAAGRKAENASGDEARVSFRGLSTGMTQENLLETWGEPDEILYTYYMESWTYRSLGAIVLLRPAENSNAGRIIAIKLLEESPISPGADIRLGDGSEELERAFGPARYRAHDALVFYGTGYSIRAVVRGGRILGISAVE
ncbi:MAG: hypothetical protein JXP39_10620 [Spirochaetales bacterium]|nr:hypothetical protein [Spirochaetales bacterium]